MSLMIWALLAILVTWTGYRLFLLIRMISLIEAGKSWVKAPAMVLDARVLSKEEAIDKKVPGLRRAFFFATYEVEGRRFGCRRVGLYRKENASIRAFLSHQKRGDAVSIFYNPSAPHESVLIPADRHSYIGDWVLMMSGLLACIALGILVSLS